MTIENTKPEEPKPNSKMTPETVAIMERVLIAGDLMKLTPRERLDYYRLTCESLQLNPLTRPFEYIQLNGKLTLYARKECTEQLRKIHGISLKITSREMLDDIYVVTAQATLGVRVDESIGAVSLAGLKGADKAHALMKSETKAKRRVTLSISGLGFVDESEIEDAKRITVNPATGEIEDGAEIADQYVIAETPNASENPVASAVEKRFQETPAEQVVKNAEKLMQPPVTIPPEPEKKGYGSQPEPPKQHPSLDVREQVADGIEKMKTKIGGAPKTAANLTNLFFRGYFGLPHNANLRQERPDVKAYMEPLLKMESAFNESPQAFRDNPYDQGVQAAGRMDPFTAFAKKCKWTIPTIDTARMLMDAWGLENMEFVAFAEAVGIDFLTDMEAQALMELAPRSRTISKTLIELANKSGRNVITLIDELKERSKRRFQQPLGQLQTEQMDQLLRELQQPGPGAQPANPDELPW